jgi:hypothetical protein
MLTHDLNESGTSASRTSMLQGNNFCPCERNAASGKHVTGHVEWRMANTSEASSREQRSYSLGSALNSGSR